METTEVSSDDYQKITQPVPRQKGGLKTMPFIIVNETFEKVASYGLLANMMIYLTTVYNMDPDASAIILFLWSAASDFTPILGAFVSDSYLGRFRVIILGSISSLLGIILLWLTAMIPGETPCDPYKKICKVPTAGQLAFLFSSFALMSIGAGGIRPCSMAFGADQVDKSDNPKNARILASFFNWYYVSVGISLIVAVTVIVYIQENQGWKVGFAVPALLMLLSLALFLLGSPSYIKAKANKSLFPGFAQVIIVAFQNKNLSLPEKVSYGSYYYHKEGAKLVRPTEKIKFLNKACIIRNAEKDINSDGSFSQPRNICTVEQVEELKALIKVMPIWSTGIFIAVVMNQHFAVMQATTMDRHMTSHFEIPAGSFAVFAILTLTIWIIIYDRLLVPILAKITGQPRGLSHKQRMGIGLLISCLSFVIAGQVERTRRKTAIQEGFTEKPHAVVSMTAMWLVPQYSLNGLAEAFNAIGQIEFYYSQFPKSMASVAVALFSLGMCIGNLFGSLIVAIVKNATTREGKESWISKNMNKGHLDYYYWLLALLGVLNFFYFLACSKAYGPCEEKEIRILEDRVGKSDQQSSATMSKESPAVSSV